MSLAVALLQQFVTAFSCNRRNLLGTRANRKERPGVGTKTHHRGEKMLGYQSNESTDVDSETVSGSTSGSDAEISSAHAELKKVLRKLTPADAAIVKSVCQSELTLRNPELPPTGVISTVHNTWRSSTRKLALIHQDRIITVKKIDGLGMNSADLLRAYFSQFGLVDDVFVTHRLNQDDACNRAKVKFGSVGFVAMARADDVLKIFNQGLQHTISDVAVCLTAYERRAPDKTVCVHESQPRFPSYTNVSAENTLRLNLQRLANLNANRIIMVRKIAKLGLGSAQLLKKHFGKFGVVEDALVTHSLNRRKFDPNHPHQRPCIQPAAFGFVVMKSAEDASSALQHGLTQCVCGVEIHLAAYEHRAPGQDAPDGKEFETSAIKERT